MLLNGEDVRIYKDPQDIVDWMLHVDKSITSKLVEKEIDCNYR